MTATQFDALSEDEIDKLRELPKVIARCGPDTKVKMIDALHRRNKYVAIVRVSSLYAYGFKQIVIVSRRFLYKC
jgi:hypothetical protein